jgi:hypothetical protein
MTDWGPIGTAPNDRTIVGKAGEIRLPVECSDGDWYAKASMDIEDWVFDGDGDRIIAFPDERCEVRRRAALLIGRLHHASPAVLEST